MLSKTQLEELKVDELKELAKRKKISSDGKKAELIERILATESDETQKNKAEAKSVTEADTNIVTVRVIKDYKDIQRDRMQHEGDIFEVTKERADILINAKATVLAE